MKRAMRWRYYCDFCGKGGCGGGAMARHESSCTANPNRVCRMCAAGDREQRSMDALVAAAREGLGALRQVTGCPACILAAVRRLPFGERPLEFDFKQECREFWDAINTERAEMEARNGY